MPAFPTDNIVTSRRIQARPKPIDVGFLSDRIYGWSTSTTLENRPFHDVTTGDNSYGSISGFSAAPG